MTDQIARAWAYLSRVAEPPCPELRALVKRVGPVEAAQRVRTGNVDGPIAQARLPYSVPLGLHGSYVAG